MNMPWRGERGCLKKLAALSKDELGEFHETRLAIDIEKLLHLLGPEGVNPLNIEQVVGSRRRNVKITHPKAAQFSKTEQNR